MEITRNYWFEWLELKAELDWIAFIRNEAKKKRERAELENELSAVSVEPYIFKDCRRYVVKICRQRNKIEKSFYDINEARAFRDRIIEKYGY